MLHCIEKNTKKKCFIDCFVTLFFVWRQSLQSLNGISLPVVDTSLGAAIGNAASATLSFAAQTIGAGQAYWFQA